MGLTRTKKKTLKTEKIKFIQVLSKKTNQVIYGENKDLERGGKNDFQLILDGLKHYHKGELPENINVFDYKVIEMKHHNLR